MIPNRLSVLVVDDDEAQLTLVQDMLRFGALPDVDISWAPSADVALPLLLERPLDVALIDYRLGEATGLDLVREARQRGCEIPLIMLTGYGSRRLDVEAMSAGAADFLDKGTLTADVLERAIRYAVQAARNRRQLRNSEERFRALIQHASDAILLLDADGRVTFASDSFESITGFSPREAVGVSAFSRTHPEDVGELRRLFADCVAQPAKQVRSEYRAQHADGTWRDCEVVAVNSLDAPAVRAVVVNYRDVTERKRHERQRARSELQYRTMFEESPVGLAHVTLAGRWARCNARLLEMLGYTSEELQQLTFADITHPDDLALSIATARQLADGERVRYDLEKRYRRQNGSYLWTHVHVSLFRDAAGVPQHFIAAIEDISARKAMEEQLEQSVIRLHGIIANLPLVLWTLDRAGNVTFSEGLLLTRFGARPGELVGRNQLEMYANHPEVSEATRRALRGEAVHDVYTIDGGVFESWYTPLRDQNGEPAGALGMALEVTERIRLEEQYRQAQKMEAVGRLAGGVAHDFNNLLTAIIGYTEMALDELPADSALHRDLSEVHRAAHSAAGLTRQLLAFSRRQLLQPQNINVNTIVARVEGLLRRLIGEDIELQTKLAPELQRVHADPTQIEQIILNLSINARDAMPAGGRLLIETANADVDQDYVAKHPGSAVGPHVMLVVTDTGVGMDEATQKRLFEPFFTTKERGRGTGLGLATVYGIVKQSGGSIWVSSEPGRGARFKVLLPAAAATEPAAVAVADTPSSVRGTETILIVEDQAEVRAITRQALMRHGYRVLDAASPDEALSLISHTTDRIDLLFTDVVMPQRTGRELAMEIRAVLPQIKVIYTSGYTESAIVHQSVLEPGLAFLPKPFTAHNLLTKIREVLDSHRATDV